MSPDTLSPTARGDPSLGAVADSLRVRFQLEVAFVSSQHVAGRASDGLSLHPPSSPAVAATQVPVIRPFRVLDLHESHGTSASLSALQRDVDDVATYAREETSRVSLFAGKLERGVQGLSNTNNTVSNEILLTPWLQSVDRLANRLVLVGDVLEHAIACLGRDGGAKNKANGGPVGIEPTQTDECALAESLTNRLTRLRVLVEPAVLAISAAYAETRLGLDPVHETNSRGGVWKPPDAFERKTTKYWVSLDDVLALKLAIAKHLPVLVYVPPDETTDEEGEEEERKKSLKRRESLKAASQQPLVRDGNAVTSVYLDSSELAVYASRLQREQGATLVRARWYGEQSDFFDKETATDDDGNAADDVVFVERKTHHESWSLDGSTKERFGLPRQALRPYLRGGLVEFESGKSGKFPSAADNERARVLAREISTHEISKKHLKPSVRTEYRRVAFQRSDCNAVRVSLDVDLTFSGAVGFADEEFCGRGREGSDETFVGVDGTRVGGGGTDGVFKRTRSVKFPYAILEIKTRDETPPGWVEEVLHEIPVLEVRKFSKFLHATMLTRTRAAAAAADKSETRFKEGALKESDYSAPHWWCFDSATGADARDLVSTRGRDFFVSGAVSDGCARLPAGALSTRDHVAVTVRDDSHPHPRGDASPDANGYDSNSNSSGEITSVDSNTTTGGSSSGISGLTRAEVGVLERFFKSNHAQGQGRASLGQGRANTLGHRGSTDTPLRGKTWCFPSTYSFRDTRGNGGETRGKRHVPVKVEPKTFFANERTLLQWLSMSVLLLFASLALLSLDGTQPGVYGGNTGFVHPGFGAQAGGTPGAAEDAGTGTFQTAAQQKRTRATFVGGAVLAPVSVAFMGYALWTYLWRARRIARREPSARYDDIVGPTVLVLVLVTVSAVAVFVAIDARVGDFW